MNKNKTNSPFVCPNCGEHLPFWARPYRRHAGILMRKPTLQCGNCGDIFYLEFVWSRGIIAMPLTLLVFLLLHIITIQPEIGLLQHQYSALFGIIDGSLIGLSIACPYRWSCIPIFTKSSSKESICRAGKRYWIRYFAFAIGCIILLAICAFYDLLSEALIGICVCISVCAVYFIYGYSKRGN